MRLSTLPFTAFLLAVSALPLDMDAFCKGQCTARSQDGFWNAVNQRCGCVDWEKPRTTQRFDIPKRYKKPKEPHTYYGTDQMHEAPADADPEPTVDLQGFSSYL